MSRDKVIIVAEYKDNKLQVVEQSNGWLKSYGVNDLAGNMLSGIGTTISGLLDHAKITGLSNHAISKQFLIISLEYTYLTYLKEERDKFPEFDSRGHTVALVKTAFATGAEMASGAWAGAQVGSRVPAGPYTGATIAGGTILGGMVGLYMVDKVKLLGGESSVVEKAGDLVRDVWLEEKAFEKNKLKNEIGQSSGTITPEGEVIMDAPQARYQDFTSGNYPDTWQGFINEQADYGSKSKSEFSDVELLNSFVAPDFSNPVTYINSVLGNNAFWNSEIAGHRLEENLRNRAG